MKYTLLLAAAMGLGLTACKASKSPDMPDMSFKIPDVKIDPKYENVIKAFSTCKKQDSEVSKDLQIVDETIKTEGVVENKQIIHVDCDKTRTDKGLGPSTQFMKLVDVDAPSSLSNEVNYVVIENANSCSLQTIDAKADNLLYSEVINIPDKDPIILPEPKSTVVGYSGKLRVQLSDSTFKLPTMYLNVNDENNFVKIKYYGKCLTYRDIKKENLGDSYNCLKAELLAEKTVNFQMLIDRPDAEGEVLKDVCLKN
ncbi:MAG: hypothetical protein V4654_01860 [Bdellovibrionota bacterium]